MMLPKINFKLTIETLPPKDVPVLVSGGVAMLKTGNVWFTGMEEPIFQRHLEWTPKWWARIPTEDEEFPNSRTVSDLVDRVADAIYRADRCVPGPADPPLFAAGFNGPAWEKTRDEYRRMAELAISTMNNIMLYIPTDMMDDILEELRGDLRSIVECSCLLSQEDDNFFPIPGTINTAADKPTKRLLELVRRIENIVGRSQHHEDPPWLDELLDGKWNLSKD